jgi:RNA polymerase sigma factor (sigma-70 family)
MEKLSEDFVNDLLNKCRKGDSKAQNFLYKHFYGMIMSICLRYAKDEDEAKDLLQETYIKIFNNINKYASNGSFEAWIKRIAINNAIDNYRKKKKEIAVFESENMVDVLGNTKDEFYIDENNESENDDSIYDHIEMKDVMEAVQYLSPAYKTVFNLYVVDDYSHQQIADELNINIGTSKSNFAKAKMKLKKILLEKLSIKNGKKQTR